MIKIAYNAGEAACIEKLALDLYVKDKDGNMVKKRTFKPGELTERKAKVQDAVHKAEEAGKRQAEIAKGMADANIRQMEKKVEDLTKALEKKKVPPPPPPGFLKKLVSSPRNRSMAYGGALFGGLNLLGSDPKDSAGEQAVGAAIGAGIGAGFGYLLHKGLSLGR